MNLWIISVYEDGELISEAKTTSVKAALGTISFWRIISYNQCGDEDDFTFTLKRVPVESVTESIQA